MIFMSDPAARTREMLGVTIVKILALSLLSFTPGAEETGKHND